MIFNRCHIMCIVTLWWYRGATIWKDGAAWSALWQRASCDTRTGVLDGLRDRGPLTSMMKIRGCLMNLCHLLMTKNKITKKGALHVGRNNDTIKQIYSTLLQNLTKYTHLSLKWTNIIKPLYDSVFTNESGRGKDRSLIDKVKQKHLTNSSIRKYVNERTCICSLNVKKLKSPLE